MPSVNTPIERSVKEGGFNRWKQHFNLQTIRWSAANDTKTANSLYGRTEVTDVGSVAERRLVTRYREVV